MLSDRLPVALFDVQPKKLWDDWRWISLKRLVSALLRPSQKISDASGLNDEYGFSMQELASWTERQAVELNARISRLMAGAPVTEADAQLAARRAVEAKALLVATKKRFSDFVERAAIVYRFPPSADALDEPGGGIVPCPGRGGQSGEPARAKLSTQPPWARADDRFSAQRSRVARW